MTEEDLERFISLNDPLYAYMECNERLHDLKKRYDQATIDRSRVWITKEEALEIWPQKHKE